MPVSHRLRFALVGLAVATACASSPPTALPPEPTPDTQREPTMSDPIAQARFDALERQLESAAYVAFDSRITSQGLIESELLGSFELTPDAAIVAFEGTLGGEEAAPTLQAGRVAIGGNGEQRFEIERPVHLNQSLLIGLTRMGLLHNLAVLAGGNPPERADGTIKAWVVIEDLTLESSELDGRPVDILRFELTVDGRTGGIAALYLDGESGLPVRREQTVAFPEGDMRVVERYERFVVEP